MSSMVGVCTPNPKQRKRQTLENRDVLNKHGQPSSPMMLQTPPKSSTKDEDQPMQRITSTCTSETNPRFQITAYIDSAGKQKRIHVATLTKSGWGNNFEVLGQTIMTYCKQTSQVTKSMVVKFRDALRE